MEQHLSLRPITPDDLGLLARIYASTREDELALTDWNDEQKAAFLAQQFSAQHQYYQEHYHDTSFDIIELDGEPIGRLYLARWLEERRIVDIALLPPYRNQGIGATLLQTIMAEARQASLPVRIHVEMFNPALTFYNRLGFRKIGERGVYYLMEWSPEEL